MSIKGIAGIVPVLVTVIAACSDTTHGPVDLYHDPPEPRTLHEDPRVSPDGRRLAYIENAPRGGRLHILDLQSGAENEVNILRLLPPNVVRCGVSTVLWCPYDPNRLLVHCRTTTLDTVAGQPHGHYDQNAYIISLDRDSLWRVTPTRFGPTGSGNGFGVLAWRHGSTRTEDSLQLGGGEIYIPQRDMSIPGDTTFISESPNGRHVFGWDCVVTTCTLLLDRQPLAARTTPFPLPRDIVSTVYWSWSPSGRALVLTFSMESGAYQHWYFSIADYERTGGRTIPTRLVRLNNAQHNTGAGDMELLTDSTVVVSIGQGNTDHTVSALLWEYKLDGTLVRQLTFEP